MRATVRLRLPDGSLHQLGHGDLIGRLPSAALHLDDARVSEAHALVSLRGGTLKLLALRGRFAVHGKPVSEVDLSAGLTILLARNLPVVVEECVLPEGVLAIQGDGLPRQTLSGVCSLVTRPRVELSTRYLGEAAAWIWSSGQDWRLRVAGGSSQPLEPGTEFVVDGRGFEVLTVAMEQAGLVRTQLGGGVATPIRLVSHYDTAHIYREGEPPLALAGISARVLGELVAVGTPVAWKDVAASIWPAVEDPHQLRRKWDIAVSRLRTKLRDARIRPDLIRPDGTGNIELFLGAMDEVVDRT